MPHEHRARVLIVDDRHEMAEMLADNLHEHGYDAVALASSREALARLEAEGADAVVTDLRMPDIDGLALLAASRKLCPTLPVIVMTAFGAIDTAIESIRQGASHYLTKPFKLDELLVFLDKALEESRVRREAHALRAALKERFGSSQFVAESRAMREVLDFLERVAPAETPVLLTGETGTGKTVVARAVHAGSPRASHPFVQVNCAALPETLLESELFGHVKGAFTGALADRQGLFVEANGGTIFLDEIGEMSVQLQAKLLHVLESGTVRPVGASKERMADFRVIAATHQNLRERVRSGRFREDLLYRLDVVSVEMPPLRRRREDLPLLFEHFFAAARAKHPSSPVERLSPEAFSRLVEYRWPGNVRELAHLTERLVLLGREPQVTVNDLPGSLLGTVGEPPPGIGGEVQPIREIQRRYAAWALEQCQGHRGHTAERLEIDGKTLAKWLSETELEHSA